MSPLFDVRAVCFDWGGTLMSEHGPQDIPMGFWDVVEAVSGAKECLQALAGHVPLAIATNATVSKRPMIELALSRVGFKSYFTEIFCFTELGYRKSQPEFWLAVQERLGQPLHRIAMIGDSFEQDAQTPRKFGVQGVWFNPTSAPQPVPSPQLPQVNQLRTFAEWVLA